MMGKGWKWRVAGRVQGCKRRERERDVGMEGL
jgi:hypothetical protein